MKSMAKVDTINDEFPEAKQEVMETFVAIAQSIKDGDIDKLISYPAYGPMFTEFKDGTPRNGGEEMIFLNVIFLGLLLK